MSGASSEQLHDLGRQMRAEMAKTEAAVRGLLDIMLPSLAGIEKVLLYGDEAARRDTAVYVSELRQNLKTIVEGMK